MPNDEYGYARRLFETLLKKHYPESAATALPDLMGVLTQIDNLTTKLTRQPTQSDALREENERLREHLISALDTLKDAEVCDDNCGPCNEARAALEISSKNDD
jgi:regulator of replication initiation timing